MDACRWLSLGALWEEVVREKRYVPHREEKAQAAGASVQVILAREKRRAGQDRRLPSGRARLRSQGLKKLHRDGDSRGGDDIVSGDQISGRRVVPPAQAGVDALTSQPRTIHSSSDLPEAPEPDADIS